MKVGRMWQKESYTNIFKKCNTTRDFPLNCKFKLFLFYFFELKCLEKRKIAIFLNCHIFKLVPNVTLAIFNKSMMDEALISYRI
jgi:hypothetical protein